MRLNLIISMAICLSAYASAQQNPFDLNHKLPKSEQQTSKSSSSNTKRPVANSASNTLDKQNIEANPVLVDTAQNTVAPPILRRDYFKSIKSNQVFHFWYFPMLAIFLALVINMDRSSISKLFKSVTNLNYLNLMYRDQRNRYRPQYILYGVLSVLSAAFFVKQALGYFWDIDISIFNTCLIIGAIYLIRHFMMALISFAFPGNSEINQYSYTIFIFNIILGMVLLLINLFIAFSAPAVAKVCLTIGVLLFVLLYIYRVIRGILLSSNLIFRNKFRFIMYICTLEIAPIFLIISIFRQF